MSIEDKLSFYALAVAVPVALTSIHSFGSHMLQQADEKHLSVAEVYTITWLSNYQIETNFVQYELGYFGALFGSLFYLMFYNLMKMYGIDIIINEQISDWVQYFTTPGYSILDEIKAQEQEREDRDKEI